MGSVKREYGLFNFDLNRSTRTIQETIEYFPVLKSGALAMNLVNLAIRSVKKAITKKKNVDCGLITQEILNMMANYATFGYDWGFRDSLPGDITFFYTPFVKGGILYNSNINMVNGHNTVEFDIIQIGVGVIYKNYYSHCIRTLLINPTERVKRNYNFLMLIERVVLYNLKDGVELCHVYDCAISFAKNENQYLAKYLDKEFGCIMDPDFQNDFVINPNSKSIAKYGMTFSVKIALIQLAEGNKYYNLGQVCTVLVRKNEPAEILTFVVQSPYDSIIEVNNYSIFEDTS